MRLKINPLCSTKTSLTLLYYATQVFAQPFSSRPVQGVSRQMTAGIGTSIPAPGWWMENAPKCSNAVYIILTQKLSEACISAHTAQWVLSEWVFHLKESESIKENILWSLRQNWTLWKKLQAPFLLNPGTIHYGAALCFCWQYSFSTTGFSWLKINQYRFILALTQGQDRTGLEALSERLSELAYHCSSLSPCHSTSCSASNPSLLEKNGI